MEFTFLLKKLVSAFIMPLPLFVLLFLSGIYFLYKKRITKAKFLLVVSFIWLSLISYPPLVDKILHHHESTYPTLHTPPSDIKYIYVLGNSHHTNKDLPITSQVNEISSVRLNEGIRLYHALNEEPILITSGYSGLYDPTPGAVMQNKLARALGVKPEKLHMEPGCKDTHEEAIAAKKYIGNAPFILVTSASHMQRAMKYFKSEGLNPIPAPTNHLAHIEHTSYTDFYSYHAIRNADIVWHEILGLLWQKI